MESTQVIKVPKIDIDPLGYDCTQYNQDPFHQNASLDFQSLENLLGFDLLALQCNYNQVPNMGFKDFEDLGSWDFMSDNAGFAQPFDYEVIDEIPLTTIVESSGCSTTSHLDEVSRMIECGPQSWTKHEDKSPKKTTRSYQRRLCVAPLELDEIQKYFEVPINEAAKELKVGVTVLKRRCRELNIMRWPHRKIKSLNNLIENVKELGLTSEAMMLEEQKRVLTQLPNMELTERTKKMRQAIYKSNYKKRSFIPRLAN